MPAKACHSCGDPGERFAPLNLVICDSCLKTLRKEMNLCRIRKLDAVGTAIVAPIFPPKIADRLVRRARRLLRAA